jgi:fluoride exporter
MAWSSLSAIGIGAVLGAWMRWGLGIFLNPVFPTLPLGTLVANLFGGFIIGVMMGGADALGLSPTLRLLVTTGFLGALTTFSTFSAETVALLVRAQYAWAAALVLVHVSGSLLLTGAGIVLVRALIGR